MDDTNHEDPKSDLRHRRHSFAEPPPRVDSVRSRNVRSGRERSGRLVAHARNLLYTRITWGKALLVLVGQRRAIAMAIRNGGRR